MAPSADVLALFDREQMDDSTLPVAMLRELVSDIERDVVLLRRLLDQRRISSVADAFHGAEAIVDKVRFLLQSAATPMEISLHFKVIEFQAELAMTAGRDMHKALGAASPYVRRHIGNLADLQAISRTLYKELRNE